MPAPEVDILFIMPFFQGGGVGRIGVSAIHPFTFFTVNLNTLYCPDLIASFPHKISFIYEGSYNHPYILRT